MKRMIIAALTLPVFLVGCGSPETSEPALEHVGGKIDRDGNADLSIYKFEIDGTQCVVMSGIKRGGLSCDWGAE